MGPVDLFFHLAGFVSPALALGLLMVFAGRLVPAVGRPAYTFWVHWGLLALVGTLALLIGLWWFGRDGKMASYALLLLAVATAQWTITRR